MTCAGTTDIRIYKSKNNLYLKGVLKVMSANEQINKYVNYTPYNEGHSTI